MMGNVQDWRRGNAHWKCHDWRFVETKENVFLDLSTQVWILAKPLTKLFVYPRVVQLIHYWYYSDSGAFLSVGGSLNGCFVVVYGRTRRSGRREREKERLGYTNDSVSKHFITNH